MIDKPGPPEKPIYGKRKTRGQRGPDLPLSPRGQDLVRSLIDSRRIIGRLQSFILEEPDKNGNAIVMSRDQVSAAVALLRKTTPDQAAMVHSGDASNPIATSLTISFKRPDTLLEQQPTFTVDANPVKPRTLDVDDTAPKNLLVSAETQKPPPVVE